jgi:hypothetical protein
MYLLPLIDPNWPIFAPLYGAYWARGDLYSRLFGHATLTLSISSQTNLTAISIISVHHLGVFQPPRGLALQLADGRSKQSPAVRSAYESPFKAGILSLQTPT